MTSIRYDDGLDCHVVRHEGRDVAYFPADQEAEATGFARRLHDGSAQFRICEMSISGGRCYARKCVAAGECMA